MDQASLAGGFTDPPHDAAQAFRGLMQAMARPGRVETVGGVQPPAPLSVAAGTIVMTLCDPGTGLYLAGGYDVPTVRDWITFHTGAPFVSAREAVFALGRWEDFDLTALPVGTSEYPDRSATLIVEMDSLAQAGATLSGPGIATTAQLNLPDIATFQFNAALFPLGLDFYFTCGAQLAALPRSTKVV